jgi:putative ABC transport system substrate-binding protein
LTSHGGGAQTQDKLTIGVVNYNPALHPTSEGSRTGKADLGHLEGENITYLPNGVIASEPQTLDLGSEGLLPQDVDLLLTIGQPATLRANTDIPVVSAPVGDPLEAGLVENLRQPDSNMAGVQGGNAIPKALEWLVAIGPHTTQVYVPYNPEDGVSVTAVASLRKAAAALGVELAEDEVRTPAEAVATIEALPVDVEAIFIVPAPSLDSGMSDIIRMATERGIAVGSNIPQHVEAGALVAYGSNFWAVGEQTARLADQTLHEGNPTDLPVERAEYFLAINLQTAEVLGLDVPADMLRQADAVILQRQSLAASAASGR